MKKEGYQERFAAKRLLFLEINSNEFPQKEQCLIV